MPTKSELNITFEVVKKENVNVELSNLLGKVLFTGEKINFIGSYTNKINPSLYASGVYILSASIGLKICAHKIFLIK